MFPSRLRPFEGLCLSDADLRDEQAHHLWKRRLHHQHLHGSGVVAGLIPEVVHLAGGDCLELAAGYAIDGAGQDIVVPDGARSGLLPEEPGRYIAFLLYRERPDPSSRRPAYGAMAAEEARTVEGWELVFQERPIEEGVEIGRIRVGEGRRLEGEIDRRFVLTPTPPEVEEAPRLRARMRQWVELCLDIVTRAYVAEQRPVAHVFAVLYLQSLAAAELQLMTARIDPKQCCLLFEAVLLRQGAFLSTVRRQDAAEGVFPHLRATWSAGRTIRRGRPNHERVDQRLPWFHKALDGAIRAAQLDLEGLAPLAWEEVEDDPADAS